MVYRNIDWWPLMDEFAARSHFILNFIIVYIAIYYNVNAVMCFNIFCMVFFYLVGTNKLSKKAMENRVSSGLLSQCDLLFAKMITKKYKIDSYKIFLGLREFIWNIQFFANIIFICIGFPTSILFQIKDKLKHETEPNLEMIERIDHVSVTMFFLGVYKDGREKHDRYFYVTFIGLIVGLIIEK
jgi:hypothetical protein